MNKILRDFSLHRCAFLCLALFANLVIADADSDDGKQATPVYQLEEGEGNFLQVSLTSGIYRYSNDPDLRDLLVIDSERNALPYRLVSLASTEKKETEIKSAPLIFFPVAANTSAESIRMLRSTRINVQGDNVQVHTHDNHLQHVAPDFYLIDVSGLEQDTDQIRVEWEATAANEYIQLHLEASRNLQDWSSLGQHTLVQIQRPEQQIKRNTIAVHFVKNDYEFMRVKVLRGDENLRFTSIAAERITNAKPAQLARQETWTVSGTKAENQTTVYTAGAHREKAGVSAWEYTRDEATPISTINLELGNYHYGDEIKIFSRRNDNQTWNLRYQGIWFNAQVGEAWQKSEPLSVYKNTDKHWRIELASVGAPLNPTLIFGWHPVELQIIANGRSPYALAISSVNTDSHTRDQIFNQMIAAFNPTWKTAGLTSLGIQPQAVASAKKQSDWKQWIFWASLVSAVVVLLFFSARLFKQLKHTAH